MLIFDLILATRRPAMTGVERYGVNLFEAMRKLRPETMAFVRDASGFTDRRGLVEVSSLYGGWLGLPLLIRRRGLAPEAVICPTAPASPLFRADKTPLCRIVHDVFPWRRDRVMPWKGRLLYRDVETLMARRYDLLLGTTEPVAADLRAQIGREDIAACGNAPGVDPDGPECAPPGAPANFVLAVGTVEPRKDYGRLLQLVESAAADAPPIVLVGRPGWGDILGDIARLAAERPEKFVWLRDLAGDDGLRWLYRRAACFVSLSQAEGFNMPLVESAMSGRPVLCSDIAIHRAVAPPWARFAAASDGPDLLWRALGAAAAAAPSAQAVAAYRRLYGWDQIAARLLELLGAGAYSGRDAIGLSGDASCSFR
ncbi:glycosyltransferase involved in cell wall biosynthesis [Rhodoblastus acidophilus]|uniref:glycosyltransferase n=1 Tax=Rhodoblastus acidophilus TaxID=1074 RepID=UPI002224EAA3|nr:glycosyltransferase involved in cell wall biosynthesis [Rhodoblastus acidophilus]